MAQQRKRAKICNVIWECQIRVNWEIKFSMKNKTKIVVTLAVVVFLFVPFLIPMSWMMDVFFGKTKAQQAFSVKFDEEIKNARTAFPEGVHTIDLENSFEADIIVLCRGYAIDKVSFRKALLDNDVGEKTTEEIIDIHRVFEAVHLYLIKMDKIVCCSHSVYAKMESEFIVSKIDSNIRLTFHAELLLAEDTTQVADYNDKPLYAITIKGVD